MSNIEIHGLPKKKANELRKRIFNLFADRHYVDEMVVTVFTTDCRDKDGKSQPFLRLINSYQDNFEEILGRLSILDMDIEQDILNDFLQKQEKVPHIVRVENLKSLEQVMSYLKDPFDPRNPVIEKIFFENWIIWGVYNGTITPDVKRHTGNTLPTHLDSFPIGELRPFIEKLLTSGEGFSTMIGNYEIFPAILWFAEKAS